MDGKLQAALAKTSITISEDGGDLLISKRLAVRNPSNRGMIAMPVISILFLCFGLALADELTVQIVVLLLSVPLTIFGVLSVSKQMTDYVKVADGKIEFRNSLRRKVLEIGQIEKVQVEASVVEEKHRKIPRSYWRQVEIWVENKEDRYRVLDFQVNEREANMAHIVGNEVAHRLKEKITHYTSHEK